MRENMIQSIADLQRVKSAYNSRMAAYGHTVLVCGGAGCVSSNCGAVSQAVRDTLAAQKLTGKVAVIETGCMGTCAVGPVMLILPEEIYYTSLTPQKAAEIVESHLVQNKIITEYTFYDETQKIHIPKLTDIPFFSEQQKIVLRNCGMMDYASLDAYIARDGYFAIAKALEEMTPRQVVDEIKASGLRGRGGAGFPTGIKWEAAHKQSDPVKYMICNADEGDPGAFMDRSLLEGDPHGIIEGMMLGAYATGASHGFVYVRAEYPIAVERLGAAIEEARKRDFWGSVSWARIFPLTWKSALARALSCAVRRLL
jgi:NADH-quinone oxidoreductase subunit F